MRRDVLFLMIFLAGVHQGYAQQKDSTRSEVQEDLERALEDFDPANPDFSNERLTQYLQDLAAHPVNINNADADMLLRVPGVNLKIVRSVLNYRNHTKPFETVGELLEVKGIGKVTLSKMRPYVTVGSGLELSKSLYSDYRYWLDEDRFEIFSRYQQTVQRREGYVRADSSGGYTGSPVKYYQRIRYESNHISANITQEKDPGEPLAGPAGLDYNSWHFALENNGKLRELVMGDYGLSFGQGLVLWDGGGFGKGREVIGSVNRNEHGVSPYSSAQETDFYRGAAATYGGNLQVSGFYSYRKRSASVIDGDTTRYPQSDGYHRTENERSQYHNMRQELYGGRARLELPFGFIGATGYKTVFNKYLDPGKTVSDRYEFRGTHTTVFGADYKFILGPALLFGEGARSENGGLGLISGVESPVGLNTELTLAYRNYAKNFQSILGDGFGEVSGEPKNEKGVYLGLRHIVNERITFSGYFDQYWFPAPRYGTIQPTRGFDWLALVNVELNSNLQFYLQGRSEIKDDEYEAADAFGRWQTKLGDARRTSFRAQLEYWVNPNIRLRMRGEGVGSRHAGEKMEYGYLIYQDIRIVPSSAWTIDARITVFDTQSYDTRVYQFENDLLYVMSNQALFDQGERLYMLLNYEPFRWMEVWAKFGITVYEDRQIIGSGLNEIIGNRRSDVGVQVRLKI